MGRYARIILVLELVNQYLKFVWPYGTQCVVAMASHILIDVTQQLTDEMFAIKGNAWYSEEYSEIDQFWRNSEVKLFGNKHYFLDLHAILHFCPSCTIFIPFIITSF